MFSEAKKRMKGKGETNRVKRGSIFLRKNFVSFVLVFTLFVLLISVGLRLYTQKQALLTEGERYLRISDRASSQINEILNEMSRLSVYISTVPFAREIGDSRKNFRESFNEMYAYLLPFVVPSEKSKQRISLLNDQSFFFSVGYPTHSIIVREHLNTHVFTKWYDDGITHELSFLAPHKDYWNNDHSYYPFTCVRRVLSTNTQKAIGLIAVDQPAERLSAVLEATADEQLFLIDEKGFSIPMREDQEAVNFTDILLHFNQTSEQKVNVWQGKSAKRGQALYIVRYLEQSNWRLLLVVNYKAMLNTVDTSFFVMLITILLLYLFLLPTSYLMMRRTAVPLMQLREQIEAVNADNLEISLDTAMPTDEITLFNEALTGMMTRLKESTEERAVMHTRELHASFLALQAQINPHFLFNVLTVLNEQARQNHTPKLENGLLRLSHMLRYVTQSTPRVVRLAEEIAHLDDYLALMKLRFENQLDYQLSCADKVLLERVKVPRMSLQPILENAFSHGFSKVLPPWQIWIAISGTNENWQIRVTNNGASLDQEQFEQLAEKIALFIEQPGRGLDELKIGGMGLVSSLGRFKHLYGDRFTYDISSASKENGFSLILSGGYDYASDDC